MKDLTVQQIATEVLHYDMGLQAFEHLFDACAAWTRDALNLIGFLPEKNAFSARLIIPSNGQIPIPDEVVMIIDVALENNSNQIVHPSFAEGMSQAIHDVGPSATGLVPSNLDTTYTPVHSAGTSSNRANVQIGTDGSNFFFTQGSFADYRCLLLSFTGLKRNSKGHLIVPKLAVPAVKTYIEWKYVKSLRYKKMQSVRRTDSAELKESFYRLAGDARGKMATPSLSSLKAAAHDQHYNFIRAPKIR